LPSDRWSLRVTLALLARYPRVTLRVTFDQRMNPSLKGISVGRTRLGAKGMSALLSVEEAATLLGIDRATCYRAIRNDTLPVPVVRLGGRIRIPRRAVERLLEGVEPAVGSLPGQLAATADPCPVCGAPAPTSASSPSRSRPICSAARRSSPAITSV
jgi:excisionase family DNA binding protein